VSRILRPWGWSVRTTSRGGLILLTLGAVYLERLDAPGPQPEGIASDGVHLWVADFQTARIYRMDTQTGEVVTSYPAPGPRPEGLAWDGTHLWHCDWETRLIYRLAVSDSELTIDRTLPTPEGARPVGLTWDGEALWLTTWQPFYLHRLDPVSGSILQSRSLQDSDDPLYPTASARPEDLAWDGTQLWITDWFTREVHRVHPESLVVTRTLGSGGPRSVGLAFHFGHLYNGDTGGGGVAPALYKLDVTDDTVPVRATTWGSLKSRAWGGKSP
jgi:sugar lactone lactonase YvrE